MKVIGLLGGVASGKSFVAEQLRRLGAEVLDADRVGHEVLRDEDVVRAVHQRWGARVLLDDGQIDRAAVARIVFANTPGAAEELRFLEQLTHPRIGQRLQKRLDELARGASVPAVVLDAPVMLKSGWDRFCDTILFVDAPRERRLQWARRRGWTEADFEAREAAQEPLEDKKQLADWVLDNSGSPEDTAARVEKFWRSLVW